MTSLQPAKKYYLDCTCNFGYMIDIVLYILIYLKCAYYFYTKIHLIVAIIIVIRHGVKIKDPIFVDIECVK